MLQKASLTSCIAVAIFGLSLTATPSNDDVVALEKRTWELWQKHDKKGFAALMDNDFIAIDTHGVAAKAQNVADIDNLIKESYELSDFQIHPISAGVVLLTYQAKLKGMYKGERIDGTYFVSSVWAKRQGKWLNVLYHETKAA
jgi:hypothetical protein